MRIARALLPLLLLSAVACDGGEGTGAAAAELGTGRWVDAPGWVGAASGAVERRAGWELVRGEAEPPPPGTDVRPAVPMAVVRADGAALLPPGPVVDAALLPSAVAWVGAGGELWLDDGVRARAVDDDVLGELAVGPAGERLAYAKRAGRNAGVWIVDRRQGGPRRLTVGLQVADRPLFVDDAHLVVVGSRPGGIAGLWLVRADGAEQPRPITNHGLRAGEPLGPTFVPPPAYHDSMRVDGEAVIYDDGRTERRVSLAGVIP